MRKTYKFYSELKILLKNLHYLSFLAIAIAVCQIQMILTLIPLQNQHVGMAKHQNFIQCGNTNKEDNEIDSNPVKRKCVYYFVYTVRYINRYAL